MSFERVEAITLASGENKLYSAVIDQPNGLAYFGTRTDPGKIVKIQLSDFTRVEAITMDSGEDRLISAVIDQPKGFTYFGTGKDPGRVVKIKLGGMTQLLPIMGIG